MPDTATEIPFPNQLKVQTKGKDQSIGQAGASKKGKRGGKKGIFNKQGPLGKLVSFLHLWLGLASGLVIIIVALTGALYAFQPELTEATQPYLHVEKSASPFISLSEIKSIAEQQLPGKEVNRVSFNGSDHSVAVSFNNKKKGYYYMVYLDPYTGKVLKVKDMDRDFFRQVLNGHMHLWLPDPIGNTIVIYGALIFGIMIISGIVLWWPKKWTKNARKQSFSVKWNASPKRLNYDLHNVFGFYASWIMIFVVFTGLVWGFDSVRNAEYWVFSGGKKFPEASKTVAVKQDAALSGNALASGHPLDLINAQINSRYEMSSRIQYLFPAKENGNITVRIFPEAGRTYNADYLVFNPYTAKELPPDVRGKFADANGGEKANRLNYDIHTGSIGGLPMRMLVFLAALVTASLPVTGFCIYWGKRKKQKKPIVASYTSYQ